MIILLAFLAGFALGWYRAARRGGALSDKLQYALAHAIPMALAGLAFVILSVHMGWAA